MDMVGFIMAYESGEIGSSREFLDGFASLVKSGAAWSLQGSYGRTAMTLIEEEFLDDQGNVLRYPEEDE